MAISRVQPMRPALSDVLDASDALETALEETNEVVAQLNRELGAEIDRATAEDRRLNSAIEAETQRATAAEQANASAIEAETQRATAAEQANASAIYAEAQRALSAERANAQAIDAEVQRATEAEQEIANDLASVPAIEYGASYNNQVPASSSIGVNITFTEPKGSTPYVLISLECDEGDSSPISNCYGIIVGADNEGFSVRLHNIDASNAETITVNWIAIGE